MTTANTNTEEELQNSQSERINENVAVVDLNNAAIRLQSNRTTASKNGKLLIMFGTARGNFREWLERCGVMVICG